MRNIILMLFAVAGTVAGAVQTPGNAAYVVDRGTGKIWVIDLGRRQMDSAISTGDGAAAMVVLPNNRRGFVVNRDASTVSVVDVVDNEMLTTIALAPGAGPADVAASPDGLVVYVANSLAGTVTVIDALTLSVHATIGVGSEPVQVRFGPDGRYAYVVNRGSGTVSVIDVHREKVAKTLAAGSQPCAIAILPARNSAYVVNRGSDSLTRLDLASNAVAGAAIPVGTSPWNVAWPADESRLYVLNSGSNNVSVVNTATNVQTALIAAGARPAAMTIDAAGATGYVSNEGSDTVSVVDLASNTVSKTIDVGSQPGHAALTPAGDYLYVANTAPGGTVTVINTATGAVAGNITGVAGARSPVQIALLSSPVLRQISPNPAPKGGTIWVTGEGFQQSTRVRVSLPTSPQVVLTPVVMDSQSMQVVLPVFDDDQATVEVVNADRAVSGPLTLRAGSAAPRIFAGGVVEAAGFAPAPSPVSGNALVAIFGDFPGMTRADAPAYQFPLPRTLGGVTVTFNGVEAPLLATIPGAAYSQINAVAPVSLFGLSEVSVAVTAGGQTSPSERANAAPTSPGIFDSCGGRACALYNNALVTDGNPAPRLGTVALYVTGLGNTIPPPAAGDAAPMDMLVWTQLPVRVLVAGVDSPQVEFAGLAPTFSGLYQVNFVVPSTPVTGVVDVQLIVGGRQSNVARMAIR